MLRGKILDQIRNKTRVLHYSKRTEEAYTKWAYRLLVFHRDMNDGQWVHPNEMTSEDVEAFLTSIAVDAKVAASTQNQALAAIPSFQIGTELATSLVGVVLVR